MKDTKKTNHKVEVAKLLALYILGDANETQKKSIALWLSESKDNASLLRELCKPKRRVARQTFINSIDKEKNWKIFSKKVKTKQNRFSYFKYAAVLFPFFALLTYWLVNPHKDDKQFHVSKLEITPGVKKAQLRLHSGELIELSEANVSMVNEDSTIQIQNRDKTLNYNSLGNGRKELGNKNPKDIVYHELFVARGQEYHLVLEDGTEVWLNSDSKLKFPISFPKEKRQVFLTGEAYFSVAENKESPFVVNTDVMDIKVLGTSFNISAYPLDQEQQTTLVSGKIAALLHDSENTSLELLPNQQIIYNLEHNKYEVKYVDAEGFGDWRGGLFVFEEETLESITNKLARWYDIHFFFQNPKAKEQKFTGKLPRFENCEVLLEIIQKTTNVEFTIDDKRESVTVSIRAE